MREETQCHHMGYSFWLTARVLLYAPSYRQDNTYHGLWYTSRGALAGMRNSLETLGLEWYLVLWCSLIYQYSGRVWAEIFLCDGGEVDLLFILHETQLVLIFITFGSTMKDWSDDTSNHEQMLYRWAPWFERIYINTNVRYGIKIYVQFC